MNYFHSIGAEALGSYPVGCLQDVIASRQQARTLAGMLGLDRYDEVRIGVAVSEAARIVFTERGKCTVHFAIALPQTARTSQKLLIAVEEWPTLAGKPRFIKLVDQAETIDDGARQILVLKKELYGRRLESSELREMVAMLPDLKEVPPVEPFANYNNELITALEEASMRRAELQRINDELTETNRGVVALYDELDTMHRVGRVVASQIDLDSLLKAITEATTEVSGAEVGGFLLKNTDDDDFSCHSSHGPLCELLPREEKLEALHVLRNKNDTGILRVDDLWETHPELKWPHKSLRSYLFIAVHDQEEALVGAMVFGHKQPAAFTERTERILASVSLQVAIGMENARLFRGVQAASAAKDQFLAMLSHELRTPLNPVFMLLASLDLRDDLPSEVKQDLQVMRRNLQLEARLIDDMLDLTRIVRGKITLHFETLDLNALLLIVRDICQEQITTQQTELELRLEAALPWVTGDSARLQQVFWNLLSNALKFSPRGKVSIVTSNPDPSFIRIEVLDNGRGIRPGKLNSIFQPFEQGDDSTNHIYGGLGLGLSICKKVIDSHSGRIYAQSEGVGSGSRFVVEFSVVAAPSTAREEAPAGTKKPEPAASSGVPRRILLVEDHLDTLQTLQRLLKRRGFEVEPAQNAQTAAALADNQVFDLVISDVGLPDRSGLDLMRELQTKHRLRGIALSGYGMDADVERSYDAGFVAHLTKPIDFAALEKAIEQASPPKASRP